MISAWGMCNKVKKKKKNRTIQKIKILMTLSVEKQ